MITHPFRSILGPIPDDWDVVPLKCTLARSTAGDWGGERGEVAVAVMRSTNFSDNLQLDLSNVAVRWFSHEAADHFDVRRGDFLIERSGGGPGQPVGRVVRVDSDAVGEGVFLREGFSNFVQLLRIDAEVMNPDYVGWCLYELHQSGIVERLQHQTTQMRNLDLRDYLQVLLPRPPRSEQDAITDALSRAGRSLTLQRRQGDTARALTTALIHHLFRHGASSESRFKDTRIGSFPQSWTIRTVRSVLAEPPSSGISPQSRADPPGVPILNVSCVKAGVCDPRAVTYVDVTPTEIEANRARCGDFFVLRGNGNREYVATGGLLEVDPPPTCIFSDKLIRLRFNPDEVADGFMPWLWQSEGFLRRLQSRAESGSGLWMISKRDIGRELFACPPLEEQRRIVRQLAAAHRFELSTERKDLALRNLGQSMRQHLLIGRIRLKEMARA